MSVSFNFISQVDDYENETLLQTKSLTKRTFRFLPRAARCRWTRTTCCWADRTRTPERSLRNRLPPLNERLQWRPGKITQVKIFLNHKCCKQIFWNLIESIFKTDADCKQIFLITNWLVWFWGWFLRPAWRFRRSTCSEARSRTAGPGRRGRADLSTLSLFRQLSPSKVYFRETNFLRNFQM